jgi:hypothetical protein
MRALTIAIGTKGALLPPTNDYPSNMVAVSVTEWRRAFDELKAGASADTIKHAFNNGQTALLAANVVTAKNSLVWFSKRSKETGQ